MEGQFRLGTGGETAEEGATGPRFPWQTASRDRFRQFLPLNGRREIHLLSSAVGPSPCVWAVHLGQPGVDCNPAKRRRAANREFYAAPSTAGRESRELRI